ncbi:MAG TPA: energy transducer TonB [Gammaproteobacteria bacterium]|nr:energy transducer TonB [Gammaproteobacteria bacterium]
MNALRVPIAVIVSGVLTTSMFWLLWHLVGRQFDAGQVQEAQRIEFSRMRRDTEVATKRDQKVERERPPPTPETPHMNFSAGGVESNVAQLAPVVDTRGAMSRMSMSAGSDRDVIPLVRIAPDYPPRALSRGLEGWVQVRFTITATGTVKDPMVVNHSDAVFDDAALKAISRWRYNPRVEGGVAVERVGIETLITFKLEK